eukprot:Selendium_serpulae@DN5064_c3_g1_i1.p1
MGSGGSKGPTPEERLAENKAKLSKAKFALGRDIGRLQVDEDKLVKEIRQEAAKGNMTSVKRLAKDLIRTRKQIAKLSEMKSTLSAMHFRLQTVNSTNVIADSMKDAVGVMAEINASMNVPELQKVMREFQRESDRMDITADRLTDATEGAFDSAEDDEETDLVVAQVLDEIGVDLSDKLSNAPITPGQLACA